MGKYADFFGKMRVEPVLFMAKFSVDIKGLTIQQLVQDKICFQQLHLDAHTCKNLTWSDDDTVQTNVNDVLREANVFKQYQALIQVIPSVLTTLYISNFLSSRKTLLILLSIALIIDSVYGFLNVTWYSTPPNAMLASQIFYTLLGGTVAMTTIAYSCVSRDGNEEWKAMRFAVIMAAAGLPTVIAGGVGGKLLELNPFVYDRIRNYDGVFIISIIAGVICLIMSAYFNFETEDEKKKRLEEMQIEPSCSNVEESISSSLQYLSKESKKRLTWRRLVNVDSLRNIWNSITRERDNLVHVELWLILVAYSLNHLIMSSSDPLMYPFVQKVYHWDATTFSRAEAISITACMIVMIMFINHARQWKINEVVLSIVGTVSMFVMYNIQGSVLNVIGFYLAKVFGCLFGVWPMYLQSAISKRIDNDETEPIFTTVSCLQSLLQMLSIFIFAASFNATVGNMVGVSFQIGALIVLISLVALVWVDLNRLKHQGPSSDNNDKS